MNLKQDQRLPSNFFVQIKAKEKQLTEEIEALLAKADRCDEEEDEQYDDKIGYEIPEESKIKEKRLGKIKEAKEALEKREQELNPGKEIDDKRQISFAEKEAPMMGKKADFDYCYNGQISVDEDNLVGSGHIGHPSQQNSSYRPGKPLLDQRQNNGSSRVFCV